MSKSLKVILSLVILVLLFVLAYGMVAAQSLITLPSFTWLLVGDFLNNTFISLLSQAAFWIALVLFVLAVVALVVIIFYPRRYTEVELEDEDGKLLLKKSAIEGYVRSIVAAEGLMKKPSVTAHLYRNKFKVEVAGQVVPRHEVIAKSEDLKREVETGLKAFFGVEKPLDFSVRVKDVVVEDNKRLKSRVE